MDVRKTSSFKVARQAAALNIVHAERDTEAFRVAADIVRAARAESALCAERRRASRLARIDTADSATTV
jgi:hypothetical protein